GAVAATNLKRVLRSWHPHRELFCAKDWMGKGRTPSNAIGTPYRCRGWARRATGGRGVGTEAMGGHRPDLGGETHRLPRVQRCELDLDQIRPRPIGQSN